VTGQFGTYGFSGPVRAATVSTQALTNPKTNLMFVSCSEMVMQNHVGDCDNRIAAHGGDPKHRWRSNCHPKHEHCCGHVITSVRSRSFWPIEGVQVRGAPVHVRAVAHLIVDAANAAIPLDMPPYPFEPHALSRVFYDHRVPRKPRPPVCRRAALRLFPPHARSPFENAGHSRPSRLSSFSRARDGP
jgi:hypothetical protein